MGWQRSLVFQVIDDEHEVVMLLGWDDRAAFESFRREPTLWQTMTGVRDHKTSLLKEVGEFSR